jgi:trans-aconitate 2-methyltransferase
LRYERERTQPSIDLASRIDLDAPAAIIDLGCGLGNSTRVLRERWPAAHITGLDSSMAMIEKARQT